MLNTFAIILSVITVPTLVLALVWLYNRRMLVLANLLLSLIFFLARSSIIYYTNPINNPAIRENREALNIIRDSFLWLLGWVAISGAVFLVAEVMVPFIHRHFIIVRTPPGLPDKVVKITDDRERRRA
jgi:hypothetical protein